MSKKPVAPVARRYRTHHLRIAVIDAGLFSTAVGFIWPDVAVELKPMGPGFADPIKMMILPLILYVIVLGVGSVRTITREITCAAFVAVAPGRLMRLVAGVSLFELPKYRDRTSSLISFTSSFECAVPQAATKLSHMDVIPTGVTGSGMAVLANRSRGAPEGALRGTALR